jgi:hypothetical protein
LYSVYGRGGGFFVLSLLFFDSVLSDLTSLFNSAAWVFSQDGRGGASVLFYGYNQARLISFKDILAFFSDAMP